MFLLVPDYTICNGVFPGFGSYFVACIVFLRIHNDVSLLLLLKQIYLI
jgi:hypothetical protein